MKYLHLTLREPPETRHPMQSFLVEHDGMEREDLLIWNFGADEDHEDALFYVVGDIDAYEAAIDDVESVADYDLTPVDDRSFYSYVHQRTRESDLAFREAFARRNLVVVPPVVYAKDGATKFTVVGEGEDLSAVVDAIPDSMAVEVDRVGEYDRRHARVGAALTDHQREVVAAAVDLGYYAVPREATLEELGAALSLSPSTVSDHLRKAEAAVMERLVE
ncbi:helix-turn-helix domain-containing protein [Halobium salinum]|uniref:Helix-turn-helix domain-containing protein n=1 Tax=Halobium salinum TaxID=1364940 RepID=A0ABD5PER8_9EURY|nr:helix-turn-helix domain-containing protein [Halobium salinum]